MLIEGNIHMKKLFITCVAVLAVVITGCKTVPTPEQVKSASTLVGVSAAAVANTVEIDNVARAEVVKIISEVKNVVPGTNETFSSAWTPVAKKHVQKLVDAKKIDDVQANMITLGFDVAMKGADYVLTVRYPQAKQYADLVEAAAYGFCDGFLSTFKTTNALAAPQTMPEMDEAAYNWLMSNCKRTNVK